MHIEWNQTLKKNTRNSNQPLVLAESSTEKQNENMCPTYDSLNVVIMPESSSIWGDHMA